MIYFFGFIIICILIIALPYKVLGAITVFFVISALITQTTASFLCATKVPFLKSVQCVIYVITFSIISLLLTVNASVSPYLTLLFPLIGFLAQAFAYSHVLGMPLMGGAVISVCVNIVGWLVSLAFGLTFFTTLHLIS
ncbi:MAG: hypothetical protein D3925_06380 [Candidatus Electrothrix sp. AR5]|nr:hypothetical protein [Candidatus Electrothrix sp. AR5]